MKRITITFLLLTLLAACIPNTPTVTVTPIISVPSLVPTVAVTATSAPPTSVPSPAVTFTPPPTAAPPAVTKGPTAPVGPAVTQTAPDCKALPGFPGCGASLPLTGKLAIYDDSHQLIQVLDFNARQDLQIKTKVGTIGLEWQDKGNILTAASPDNQPALAWVNPVTSKTPALPKFGPQGQPIFSGTDGSTAWLEQKDGLFLFHVRPANSDKDQVWPAEPKPSDKIHDLLGWVPGTPLLLAGYHFGSNSMWVTGNQLYSLDSRNGAVKELPASMRLGSSIAWHPSQPAVMAFDDSSQSQLMGASRLAILNVNTAKVTRLIADTAVSSTYPAWTPDGLAILHAAIKVGNPPAANDPFALAGIYRTEWPAGTTTRITTPPQGQRDAWPQPLADGKNVLYLRYSPDTKQAEVRLAGLDSKLDAPVVTALNVAPAIQSLDIHWQTVLAYVP